MKKFYTPAAEAAALQQARDLEQEFQAILSDNPDSLEALVKALPLAQRVAILLDNLAFNQYFPGEPGWDVALAAARQASNDLADIRLKISRW